jgi:hypothetical protein
MMGIKERNFRPLPDDLSLDILVPKDNFYRHLEERIDLSFVRELVLPLYAKGGRHSVDPVVFFKLQLVLFFENLRSERQLMEVVADRLSLRWYVGYDLLRAVARPLEPHQDQGPLRSRDLPKLLREDRPDVRRGRACQRQGAVFRLHQGRGRPRRARPSCESTWRWWPRPSSSGRRSSSSMRPTSAPTATRSYRRLESREPALYYCRRGI